MVEGVPAPFGLAKVLRGTDGGRVERGESLPEQGRGRAFPRLPLIEDGSVDSTDHPRDEGGVSARLCVPS